MLTVTITNTIMSKTVNGSGGGTPPSNTVAPVISGSSVIGSTLTSTTGTWIGDPVITYSYQWKQNGNDIVGETSSTYVIVSADYLKSITCEVTATNPAGFASAVSNSIIATATAPVNTVAPVISGTNVVGSTLSSTTGTWTGTPTITYTYQWKRNGSNIASATSSTYTLVQADATFAITCAVTATNLAGSAEATSNALTIIDADAQAFFTASGLTGTTNQSAINKLVVDIKNFGIWTKMKAIYPFIGGTAALHKWNLKNPLDTNAAFRLTFNGGWTHSATGATPNGTNAFADTFLIPNTAYTVATNAHFSFYSRTNINQNAIEIGTFDNTQAFQISLFNGSFSNNTRSVINNAINLGSVDTNSLGFYVANRNGTTVKNFKNSSIIATGTNTVIAKTTTKIWIGAQNFNNGLNLPSSKQCAFASIGDGLTDTEAANFYTAVQAYQTTLSRNV